MFDKKKMRNRRYIFTCRILLLLAVVVLSVAGCGAKKETGGGGRAAGKSVVKCGKSVCQATESCKNDRCVPKGCDSGGPKCTGPGETCYQDACILGTSCQVNGDCDKALGQGYQCTNNLCQERLSCNDNSECVPGKSCKYNACVSNDVCRIPSDCTKPGETCLAGRCGAPNNDKCVVGGKRITCGALEQCSNGVCVPTCAPADTCLGKCTLDPTQECTSTGWVDACSSGKKHCETGHGPVCCGSNEACVNSLCIKVESDCDFTKEEYCKIGQYCEQSVKKCIAFADNSAICGYVPPSSNFNPQLKLKWEKESVFATPVVINLDDDNHDGKVDDKDIPEIAFVTNTIAGTNQLIVLHGKSTPGTTTPETYWESPTSINVAGNIAPAAADLDGDGKPEIVIVTRDRVGRLSGLYAFHSDGTKYQEKPIDGKYINPTLFAGAISIADINQDGKPEIIALGNIFDNELNWLMQLEGYKPEQSDIPVVADMDMDGCLDVVVGRRVYHCEITDRFLNKFHLNAQNMTGESTPAPSPKTGAISAAVANLQGDASSPPEIVSVEAENSQSTKGKIYITDHTGKIIFQTEGPEGTSRGGAPTIADFNGDGEPNIGIAFDRKYTAYKLVKNSSGNIIGLTPIWEQPISDLTSAITGSSIFDFQGDGKAEVVYNDENTLYVFSGDGTQLFKTPNSTGTQLENPVIADIDNDGHADIVVVTNPFDSSKEKGIRVFSNNNWVSTRPIWNQAVYNVVNINRNGTVPQHQKANWQQPWLNNFRQNVQDGNPKLAPDLIIEPQPIFEGQGCATSSSFNIHFKLKNIGSSAVRAGLVNYKVVAKFKDGTSKELLTGINTKNLGTSTSDNYEEIIRNYTRDSSFSGKGEFDLEFIVDEANTVSECNDGNNKKVLQHIGAGAPDATVLINSVLTDECFTKHQIAIHLEVQNSGAVALPAGTKVDLYSAGQGLQRKKITTLTTTREIAAGGSEQLTYTITNITEYQNHLLSFEAVIDPDNTIEECNESNNSFVTPDDQQMICYVLG